MPRALGQPEGVSVSVFERTVDDLELVHLPVQVAPATEAFVDLREQPSQQGDTPLGHPSRLTGRVDEARLLISRHQRLALAADVTAAAASSAVATVLRFGTWRQPAYVGLSLAVPVLWTLLATTKRAYEHRFIERASEECRRLWEAGLLLFITLAVLSFSIRGDVARGYVCLVVPLTVTIACTLRALVRGWMRRQRRRGRGVRNVLVVGPNDEARGLFERLQGHKVPGLRPVGICPQHANTEGVARVLEAVDASGA